jgi:FixJ family two-component response regulator
LSNDQIVSIVDDDEVVRLATSSLVRSLGWQARTFASAEEFLQSGCAGKTLCLISDIMMQGMSGIDLHDRLLELGCAPPTIFMTAYSTAALRATIEAKEVLAFLDKPIDATAVASCLEQLLGQP